MLDIEKLLGKAKESGASDVHITVGVPPKVRVQGRLKSMEFDKLMPEETEKLLTSIMTEEQKNYLDENGEVDFSFAIPALGRFRANVFKQRGSYAAAFRIVLTEVADEEELGLPREVTDLSDYVNNYRIKKAVELSENPQNKNKDIAVMVGLPNINTFIRLFKKYTGYTPGEYRKKHFGDDYKK